MKFEITISIENDTTLILLVNQNFDTSKLEVVGGQAIQSGHCCQLTTECAAELARRNWDKVVEACKTSVS